MTNKKTFAWMRAAAAVLLAAILLAVTGFAFVDMLAGPGTAADGVAMETGAYRQADVSFVMDIVGVEKNAAGKEVAYYAVSPVGSSFMMIRYPAGDLEALQSLAEETRQFLEGESLTMDFHMIVTGVVEPAGNTVQGMLAEWFAENVDWMTAAGVIPQQEDYSAYLSAYTIQAGTVGSMRYAPALVLTILAALFVVYALVEMGRILCGAYDKKSKKTKKMAATAKVERVKAVSPAQNESAAEKPASEKPVGGGDHG